MTEAPTKDWPRKLLAASLAVNAALALALVVWAGLGLGRTEPNLQRILDDERIKREVVEELASEAMGVWDSHNDPDVGRVLQPWVEKTLETGTEVASNGYGLRERQFELPKPEGLVRVVVLGDSLVFGQGVAADERMGRFLEDQLVARGTADAPDVEVLHLGLSSWNVVAECRYVRRQLSLLQPDLVFHVTTANDLDDVSGVRGFGAMARFTPRYRDRGDGILRTLLTTEEWGVSGATLLAVGLEYESRERFREASAEMARLASLLESQGGRYVAVLHWFGFMGKARKFLVDRLRDDQVIYLSNDFSRKRDYWVSARDRHWNAKGMEELARVFYGAIVRRDLLPSLGLEPWAEAEDCMRRHHDPLVGREDPEVPFQHLVDELDHSAIVGEFSIGESLHFMGGIDGEGLVSPYAAITLRNRPGGELVLRGAPLGRPEIAGTEVKVWVDEVPLGEFVVGLDEPLHLTWPLPEAVAAREIVAIRLQADDYAYVGPDLQHCVVFRLESASIEEPTGR